MDWVEEVRAYVDRSRDRYLDRLRWFCEQPSVSATGQGMADAVEVTQELMSEVGLNVTCLETLGYPAVLGQKQGTGEAVLGIYGHYDVQPVDPIDEWDSDPFKLTVSNGRIYARGVADTKGHVVARLCAIEAYEECIGPLPLGVKVFVEGEEEVGSPHLSRLASEHHEDLKADGYLWESGHNTPHGRPTIYLGMKGMLKVEITAKGARNDMHSMYGALVPNPLWELAWTLCAIKESGGTVKIPGFYDSVRSPTDQDLRGLRTMPIDPDDLKELFGIDRFVGDYEGFEALQQHVFAPTCTINGWWGGYAGEGQKTVLPARGGVKLDFRLVSDQDPDDLFDWLQRYFDELGFRVNISSVSTARPAKTEPDDPLALALVEACTKAYGQEPGIFPMLPATGPMYDFCHRYGRPACGGAGVIRPDSNVHGPNENIHLHYFLNAVVATVVLIDLYAQKVSQR